MTPPISILIPHYNTEAGRRAQRVCLDRLTTNTTIDYELIVAAQTGEPFAPWNDMAARASADWIMLLCFDQYVQRGWDVPVLDAVTWGDEHTLFTLGVVESGFSPSHEANEIEHFGTTPEDYAAASFEAWADRQGDVKQAYTWAFPWVLRRDRFLALGGFDVRGIEYDFHDYDFVQKWESNGGTLGRISSRVYHLMRWALTGDGR